MAFSLFNSLLRIGSSTTTTTTTILSASRKYATSPLTILTEDEKQLQDTVRKFTLDNVAPHVKEMDATSTCKPEIIEQMFANGFMGVETPMEYGGCGMSFLSACLVVEELAKVDPSISVICDVQNTLVNTLIRQYGNEDQKKEFLTKLATKHVGSFCLSEESSGSDAFALKATAVADGDNFTLNGTKMWITNAGEAQHFLVMANANPSAGYKGITCFIVDRDMAGVTIGKKEDKLGIRASSTCPVILENVSVSKDRILGEFGKGYKYAINILNEGRIGIGAQMLGLAQGVFDQTIPFLKQRKQFGTAIADFQAIQQQYAQVATEIEAAKLMVYNAARLKEAGLPFVKEAAMAKLYSSQVAEKAASGCVEWLGGVGFTKDFPAEKFYRDCKIGAIYEGTSNIQRQTIAKIISAEYEQ